MIEINSLVVLVNDPEHVIYKVKSIKDNQVEIIGLYYRIKKIITIDKIHLATTEEIELNKEKEKKYYQQFKKYRPRNKRFLFGRILHIDGDEDYLKSCLELYEKVGINAIGIYIDEKEMAEKIESIIQKTTPDIIVITGHDSYNEKGLKDRNNYENSLSFGRAIRIIRKHYSDSVIIAGACCSNFEYLIAQGANFASSPKRINTHTYDPAVVAVKVAATSINKTVDFNDIIKFIENGKDAIGGIETYGKMRLIY